MRLGRGSRIGFTIFAVVVLAFVYVPIGVVTLNSFNSDRTFGWPPPGLTTQWWSLAWEAQGPRDAILTSVKAGLGATAIALVLGSLLSLALTRYDFFGKYAISILVVLPIALPGIVTGIALQSVISNILNPVFGINAGLFTIIVGHATFCIVVTTFTAGPGTPTLPIWIFNNLFRPNQAPVVNVVAVVLIAVSILPVWLAQRLGGADAAESRL